MSPPSLAGPQCQGLGLGHRQAQRLRAEHRHGALPQGARARGRARSQAGRDRRSVGRREERRGETVSAVWVGRGWKIGVGLFVGRWCLGILFNGACGLASVSTAAMDSMLWKRDVLLRCLFLLAGRESCVVVRVREVRVESSLAKYCVVFQA